jgi:hypothetical protein
MHCHPHFRFGSYDVWLCDKSQRLKRSEAGCRWHPERTTGKAGQWLRRNEAIVQFALSETTISDYRFLGFSSIIPPKRYRRIN